MEVAVLGAGAYGLALSKILLENGNNVKIWTKIEQEKDELKTNHYSSKLKEYKIPKSVEITTDLKECVKNAKLIVFSIPAKFASSVVKELSQCYNNQYILIATKGIEQNKSYFMSELINRYITTNKIGVISGPSFAIDIIEDVPIGLSLGSNDWNTIKIVKKVFENEHFKLSETKDIIGLEICGAIKNVLAIASGMIAGMNLPISTQALFLTEALNEIKKLIYELDGDPNTILSLAGFGDIILTCTSEKSRNYSFGKIIGESKTSEEIDNYVKSNTIEGLYTLKAICKLIKNKKINAPIIDIINDIVEKKDKPQKILRYIIEKK